MSNTKLDQATAWQSWKTEPWISEGKSGKVIVRCETKEQAELIVRAVNSHDALVNALENLIDAAKLVSERWSSGDLADAVRSLDVDRKFAEAAVKLARGEDKK